MAFSFDGVNDRVGLTDHAALTFPDADWTISGFVKLDNNDGSDRQWIVGWNGLLADPSFALYITEDSSGNPGELFFGIVG